ncbi:MAG TPA: hypothetical protein VKD70_14425 [Candidatus Acidoferrum sp.]|nr:hypothetical protein [Candidatus Acidoferrum sp.]
MLSRRTGLSVLIVAAVLLFAALVFIPRIPQPLAYHHFADQRAWLGIPNFGNVISNLPFAIFGVMGLAFLFRANSPSLFGDSRERIPWAFFFLGIFLTAFGSAYYHWHPDNSTLVWDRLPMTIAFTGLIASLFAERISLRAGLLALGPLLFLGVASVVYWYFTELHGRGDLRFYFAVQASAFLLTILSLFLFRSPYTRAPDLGLAAASYLLAVLLEQLDHHVFVLLRVVSGHTLKHIAASLPGYWILRMLKLRQTV